jgi:drug/metabolite transporter (DMT)-like permease
MTSQRQTPYQRNMAGRGYLVYYVVAVLIWGSEAVLTKAFLLDVLTPGAMLLLRSAITVLVLSPLVLLDRPPLRRMSRQDWAALLALSLLGTALPTLIYFVALDMIPASTTMLLYRTEPIFVIVLSVVALRQRIALRVWLLTLVAVACAYLIAVGQLEPPPRDSSTARGTLLMLASTALFAWATLLGKALLDKVSPLALVWLRFGLALPLLAALFGREAMAAAPQLSGQNWFWLLWMGGISSGLAYVFYYKGLQGSNVVIASVVTLLGPVVGVTLSVVLLNERFSAVQVAGIVGLLVTMYFLSTSNLSSVRQPVVAEQVDDDDPDRCQALMEVMDVARIWPQQTEYCSQPCSCHDVPGRWHRDSAPAAQHDSAPGTDCMEPT